MADQTTVDEPGVEIVPAVPRLEHDGLERLQQKPIIDRIDPRTLALIKAQVAPKCTDAEVGHFLELCAHYGLDPFAREAWCAKSTGQNARLLIMVGRDGLRKVAQRNGFNADGDIVHANDEFTVERMPDRSRRVHHRWADPDQRGQIIGAWAECWDPKTGEQHGFFYAPLSEYMPANVSPHSPWSKQTSVMILAAAERQALRQATPLGGLLIEGEDESINATRTLGAGDGDGTEPGWQISDDLIPEVERSISAFDLDRATVQMQLNGQSRETVENWIGAHMPPLPDPAEPVPDAEVVLDDDPLAARRACQERYDQDPEFKTLADELLDQLATWEAADESGDGDRGEIAGRLDAIRSQMDAAGIPANWWPASDGGGTEPLL